MGREGLKIKFSSATIGFGKKSLKTKRNQNFTIFLFHLAATRDSPSRDCWDSCWRTRATDRGCCFRAIRSSSGSRAFTTWSTSRNCSTRCRDLRSPWVWGGANLPKIDFLPLNLIYDPFPSHSGFFATTRPSPVSSQIQQEGHGNLLVLAYQKRLWIWLSGGRDTQKRWKGII